MFNFWNHWNCRTLVRLLKNWLWAEKLKIYFTQVDHRTGLSRFVSCDFSGPSRVCFVYRCLISWATGFSGSADVSREHFWLSTGQFDFSVKGQCCCCCKQGCRFHAWFSSPVIFKIRHYKAEWHLRIGTLAWKVSVMMFVVDGPWCIVAEL